MKRLMILLLAACFVVGSAMSAKAVEITASGSFDFMWGWITHGDLFGTSQDTKFRTARQNGGVGGNQGTEDEFKARQRERIQVNFVASENVQGVLYFEMGETFWGNTATVGRGSGGALGTDGVSVEVRRAYIDFNVPNTDLVFRAGLQGLALPAAVAGSPILDDDAAGVVASYTVNDMIKIAAFWSRPIDLNNSVLGNADGFVNRRNTSFNDEFDLVGTFVNINVDGVMSLTPYVMYGIAGTDFYNGGALGMGTNAQGTTIALHQNAYTNNDYQYMWWVGGALEFTMLDPLTFGLDVAWGTSIDPSDRYLTRSGWYLAARADYKTAFVTPGLIGWWTSGDDGNIYNGSERLPVISGTFGATTFGFDGYSLLSAGNAIGATGEGTWGIALQFADISFVEDLTHTLRVAYIGGTNSPRSVRNSREWDRQWAKYLNNPSGIMLTTTDHAWEINFDHKYQIYENLAAVVEMGMLDVQRQASTWRAPENVWNSGSYNSTVQQLWKTSTAWKLAMGLQYRF